MKKGFTLAEVLITLAIIGIVATMTIPTLINKYQEKITVTKVKKMYSTLSQAYGFYLAENDKAEYIFSGDEGSAEKVFKIFEPYLKVSEDCTSSGTKNCFSPENYYTKDSNLWVADFYDQTKEHYQIRLNDGSAILFKGSDAANKDTAQSLFQAYYDTNGKDFPNTLGKDAFIFIFDHNGTIPYSPAEGMVNNCIKGSGHSCAGWIVMNSNMEYLHCPDKLSWEKTTCN